METQFNGLVIFILIKTKQDTLNRDRASKKVAF